MAIRQQTQGSSDSDVRISPFISCVPLVASEQVRAAADVPLRYVGGIFVIAAIASPRYKVSPMVEESKIECKFRALCAHAIVVGWDRKLAAQVADGIIIKRDSQFQFNGHPSLVVAEIPDTFAQNGIHHRSNLILRLLEP